MKGRKDVAARARKEDHMYRYCRVIGCNQPARAGTSNGLDRRYCRKHADHYSRHGSPYKRSYSAADLKPHRKTVRAWLMAQSDDPFVRNAVQRIEGLYSRSGAHTEAFRLAGMCASERASKAWARLRESSVEPFKVIEAWLVVLLAIKNDPQPDESSEFRRVQAAKLVHRMASGSHRRWEREVPVSPGSPATRKEVTELHKYPHSRGRVLRIMGEDIEEACALVSEVFLRDINSTSPGGAPDQ